MRYPKFLAKSNTIGVCAPSFGSPIDPYYTRYIYGKKRFEELGYKFIETPHILCLENAESAPKEVRAQEFLSLWNDNNVDFIMSIAGGELMMEILPYINFEELKNSENIKYFMGYSDNTNLSFLLATLCDIASIYGNHIGAFSMEPLDISLVNAYNFITGNNLIQHPYELCEDPTIENPNDDPRAPYFLTKDVEWKSLDNKDIYLEGRLIGGCLDVLSVLVGTKFDNVKEFNEKYKDDGIIFFLEACDLNLLSFIRSIWQLEHAGWFKHCKGIILGRPIHSEDCFDISLEKAIKRALGHLNIPVLYNLDFGHVSPSMTLINGSYVRIKFNDKEKEIETLLI